MTVQEHNFEWVQANQANWSSEAEVEARLANRGDSAWQQLVAEAHQHRGLYP